MRVLLLTNGLRYGGAERVVEALADGLRERGDEVRVVATTRGGPVADALRARCHPVEVLGIRGAWDLRVVARLARLIRRHRIELVHAHLAVSDIAAAGVKALCPDVQVVSTVHNPGVELGRLKRALWGPALRSMDRVLAVSRAAQGGLPDGVLSTIVHPSLVDLDAPRLSQRRARRELGLPVSGPVVLAIGRLAPVKGLDVLAEAALQLPGVTVAVLGDGPERARLASTPLRLLGSHPDAACLVAAADVLALPSRSEGFPQVPLHAMAAEVPVVATHVGGTPEVVLDGVTGRLVAPENSRALAEALRSLLEAPATARQLGAAGRRRLEEAGLTKAAMIDNTRRAYPET